MRVHRLACRVAVTRTCRALARLQHVARVARMALVKAAVQCAAALAVGQRTASEAQRRGALNGPRAGECVDRNHTQ